LFKEADLCIGFSDAFVTAASREATSREEVRRRLLLCLDGLGTNARLKRLAVGPHGSGYKELLHTWRHYIDAESLRDATRRVANATLAVRDPRIWGEGTTACASDSKHFGAVDQNLVTEWHVRYGGRGVMIYWHVERGWVCIHSRLRRCSSSEVAAMIEGVLRHDTEMEVERQHVDSHGQSERAFAFCRTLGFRLLPRLKAISGQRLYLPEAGGVAAYPNLACIQFAGIARCLKPPGPRTAGPSPTMTPIPKTLAPANTEPKRDESRIGRSRPSIQMITPPSRR
jgi:hypothetical protein